MQREGSPPQRKLVAEMHKRGINVRLLPELLRQLPAGSEPRLLILQEMLCRTVKARFRRGCRALSHCYPQDEPYLALAASLIHLAVGMSP